MAKVAVPTTLPIGDGSTTNRNQPLFGRYDLGRLLGQGTFAKVYHAKHIETGESVAIKVISKDHIRREPSMVSQIMREISVMRLVKHPNVVDLREVMATRTRIYFVMELVRGGELFAKVSRGKLREDVSRKYFRQLISAIDFCHSRGVSHRDLKPENLLLDHEGNLKISDFGLSALPEQQWQDGLLHTQCGTPAYVAPEVLRKKGYDGAKADLWSCGVILYVLLAGFLPFREENLMRMYRKVFRAEYEFPPWFSPGARRLIKRLLVADPQKRITVLEIMQDPWFRKECHSTGDIPSTPNPTTAPPAKEIDEEPQVKDYTPALYNAFDLIATMSSGLDLSGMFESETATVDKAASFTSRLPAATVLGRLEEVGRALGFRVTRGGPTGFEVRMEAGHSGRQGKVTLAAEVFDVATGLAVVEFRRIAGDPFEYDRLCREEVRPGLRDVVWTWQGDVTPASCNDPKKGDGDWFRELNKGK